MSAEPRPLSPHIETAIHFVFLVASASCVVYMLETRPPWVDSSMEVGLLVASAIGVSVGMREDRQSVGERLLLVAVWSVALGAMCSARLAYLLYFPPPLFAGQPINLLRDHPFLNVVLFFPFGCAVFGTIATIMEEITAITRRCVSYCLPDPMAERINGDMRR